MKTICIDARLLGVSGIGTYIESLLPYFLKLPFTFYVLVREKKDLPSQFQQIVVDVPPFSLKEQFLLPFFIPHCDVFFSPHCNVPLFFLRAKKKVATLHDTLFLSPYSHLGFLEKCFASLLMHHIARHYEKVITVSQFSKHEIEKHLRRKQIEVIYNGIKESEIKPIEGLPASYLLCFYNEKPYKNFKAVLHLFQQLKKTTHLHLIIVGTKKIAEKRVHYFPSVSHEELFFLYKNAIAFIYPSFYEGFGLPPLEAMSQDCPVIASKIESVSEVCGDAALYFNPNDVDAALPEIQELIDNPLKRQELVAKGRERARLFSWEKSANTHLQLLESLL